MRTKIYSLLITLICSVYASAQFDPRPPGNCLKTYADATAKTCEAVNIGHILPATEVPNYTIEFWMNPDILVQYGPNFGADNDQTHLRFRFNSASKFTLWQGGTKWEVADATIKEAINQKWGHVAITFKDLGATTEANLFINGVNIGTTFSLPKLTDGFKDFKLGTHISTGTNRYNRRLEGRMDEFRIWTSARTQTDIQNNMNKELEGNEAGLLVYYNFNESSGTTVTNKSTANAGTYDGTIETLSIGSHFIESDAFIQEGVLAADFTVAPITGLAPHTVTYSDASVGSPTGWNWTFPGGSPETSTEQNPSVTYTEAGTYSATLRTTNAKYEHSVTKENEVWVNGYDGGKALAFDGVDDYMIVPDIFADTERLATYTIEFWMYQKTFGANQTAQIRGGTQFTSFNFGVRPAGEIFTGFDEENNILDNPIGGLVPDSTCYIKTDPGVFETNLWHHYAVTFDNSIMKFYKNGIIIGKDTTTAIDGPSWNDSIAYHIPGGLHIGSSNGGDKGINGYIDEFRVWSVERSETEIIQSLLSDVPADSPGLEVYYQFEDGDITQTAGDSCYIANKANASKYIGRLRHFTKGSELAPSGAFSLDPKTIPSIPDNISTNQITEFPARVYVKNQLLNVEMKDTGRYTVAIYNITGKMVKHQKNVNASYTTDLPSKGIYIVAITSETNTVSTTKVVY